DLRGAELPPAVRHADVLVTTSFHSADVQRVAKRLGKPCITIALRPDILAEVSRQLDDGPLYYVATDPRVEPKLRRMLAPVARVKNLRVLIIGRDDLDVIPLDAPTFVMTSAWRYVAEHYGDNGGPGKAIFHPPR